MKNIIILGILLFAITANSQSTMKVREGDMSCDRACLNNFIDQYLDAMVAHSPSNLPLTRDVRMTENGIQLNLTQGLWETAIKVGNKQYISDVYSQQAGFIGVVYESDGQPKMLALRLRIKNMEIKEIEMVVGRPGSSDVLGNNLENWKPAEIWSQKLNPSEQQSRADLLQSANNYFEAIEKDEKGVANWVNPCSWNGNREANGAGSNLPDPNEPERDANYIGPGDEPCDAMFGNGYLSSLSIPSRNFWIVDQEMGWVFGVFVFSIDKPYALKENDPIPQAGLVGTQLNSGLIAEAFKIIDGEIYRIDAVTSWNSNFGFRSGW